MKVKQLVSGILLPGTLLLQWCQKEIRTNEESTNHTYTIMADTLTRPQLLELLQSEAFFNTTHNQQDSIQNQKTRDSIYNLYKGIADRKANTECIVINIERVKAWPLGTMRKLPKTLWRLLWDSFSEEIFEQYNPELFKILNERSKGNIKNQSYNIIEQNITVPAVYPDLVDFFVPSLKDFLSQHPWVQDLIGQDPEVLKLLQEKKEVIITTRNSNDKHVIGYYKEWYIVLAQYQSPGTGKIIREYDNRLKRKRSVNTYSPEGIYYTNFNKDRVRYTNDSIPKAYYDIRGDRKDSLRTSASFGNAPMPYAIPIAKDSIQTGVFFHTGQINGKALSNGCFRQAGYISQALFDHIEDRIVPIISFNLYDQTTN